MLETVQLVSDDTGEEQGTVTIGAMASGSQPMEKFVCTNCGECFTQVRVINSIKILLSANRIYFYTVLEYIESFHSMPHQNISGAGGN